MPEWDWPPPRSWGKPLIDGKVESETVVLSRTPKESWPNQAADLFYRLMITSAKVVLAVILALVIAACVWLISAILKAG